MAWNEIPPEAWDESAFRVIGNRWLLVAAPQKEGANAMTASWGGFGVLWGRPVVYLWVRPERYTHFLLEEEHCFSVNILPPGQEEVYRRCGSVSGRDCDKCAECGLTVQQREGIPYLLQSETALLCRLLYQQPMSAGGYCDYSLLEDTLKKGDLHTLFIGEVVHLMRQEDDNRPPRVI